MNSLEKVFKEIENLKNIIANEKCEEVKEKFKRLLQDTLEEARGLAEGVGTGIKKTFDGFRYEDILYRQEMSVKAKDVTKKQVDTQAQGTNRVFTTDELANYNGQGGNPAYIAVEGIVYDITPNLDFWTTGINSAVVPGRDVTTHVSRLYGSLSILGGLKIVGILRD